jgi:hypothetical protein
MGTIAVNPPKTPVTKGSNGIAAATLPNVCKMPGPPAPFVPTPLPNIGNSGKGVKDYSTSVTFDGEPVAIRGASFTSSGDIASQGTGGGIVSNNVEGPTTFIGPGALDVRVEGKNVQLLTDPMLNNNGPSGSPANSATMGGLLQAAKAKNPANEDVCGAGKHKERIEHPQVPKSEWHPSKRVEAMRAVATTAEDLFEVAAAEHNIADGSITHGSQLSRNASDQEIADGAHNDDQKIWAICTVCGYRREIDQAPDRKTTVEAKSTSDAISSGDQKANNRALVEKGNSVTYKSPELGRQKLTDLLDQGFKHIPIPGA